MNIYLIKVREVMRLKLLMDKIREVAVSVMPITIIVLILSFTLTPMTGDMTIRFLLGAICIIAGLAVFLLGVDLGITPVGNLMGTALTRSGKLIIVLIAGAVLGFFISIAEPDLHILADQFDTVTGGILPKIHIVAVVSIGIAVLLSMGLGRIIRGDSSVQDAYGAVSYHFRIIDFYFQRISGYLI